MEVSDRGEGERKEEEGGRKEEESQRNFMHIHVYMYMRTCMHVCHLFQSEHIYMQLEVVYFFHHVLESYM